VLEFIDPNEQFWYETVKLLTPLNDGSIKEIIKGTTVTMAYSQGYFCPFCRSARTCSKPEVRLYRERELLKFMSKIGYHPPY
jgi:hypothetical protein